MSEQLAQVSNGIVQIFSDSYGRGPTRAKSYHFDHFVVTVLEDLLTTVEETLVRCGEIELVRQVRLTYQEAEADRFKAVVSEAMGRRVVNYHSQVVFDPPMGFELFVLEPTANSR